MAAQAARVRTVAYPLAVAVAVLLVVRLVLGLQAEPPWRLLEAVAAVAAV
jgi:hypothetical protein